VGERLDAVGAQALELRAARGEQVGRLVGHEPGPAATPRRRSW
jgi:hypothetical protein